MRMKLLIIVALIPFAACPLVAQTVGVRDISVSDRNVIQLNTRLRYTTMIVLPEDEEILDVVCGDKDFWSISAAQNIAHVKPAKEGAATNLNLVTATGTVYSFLLNEGKTAPPDLKVYVAADQERAQAKLKYYAASHVAALQSELAEAHAATQRARRQGEESLASFKQQYPLTLQFTYGSPKYAKPFFVRSIWHDGQFTYIRSDARELPALYEVKDGYASLVNFQVHASTYVVPKVLDNAYLALGKQRFTFQQGR
jgi:type IV secretory pathway VirB9-like protein